MKDEITINGRRYALIEGFGSNDPCEHCALKKECLDAEYYYCKNFVSHKTPLEDVTETVTEEKAYDDYQERSQTAGDRGNMLAWAFVCTMFAQLIGSKYFREPYVLAAGGIAYLMLSTMQAWWQTVALWIIKCRIKSKNLSINDYPDWVGGGAWVFYWLKMIVITVTSIYAIVKFIALL